MNGSIHEVFHGSFSFAPREVSNEIIGVYNQVVGFDPNAKNGNATAQKALEGEGDFDEEEEEAKF